MKPDLDLDSLIQRIREEAARPEYQTIGIPAPAANAPEAFVPRAAEPVAAAGQAHVSSTAARPMTLAANVDELLLAGSDEAFVDQAYRTILHRAPDAAGRDAKLALLRAGHRRTYVIHILRTSDEARKVDANLPGMGRLNTVYRVAGTFGRGPLRPLARALDRVYSAWRHVRIAVNGIGLRRLDNELHDRDRALASFDMAAHGLRADVNGLRADLDHARTDAQSGMQHIREDVQAVREHLQQINERMQADVHALREHLQAGVDTAHERIQGQENGLAGLGEQVADQGRRLADQEQRLAPLPQLGQDYRRELDLLRARINMLHRRTLPVQGSIEPPATLPARDDLAARIDAYYVSFEDAHRGSEDSIRAKLEGYIDKLTRLPQAALTQPVVDIGCGRGEWLRLLSESGFTGIGVDLNPDMVARCQAQGLTAHHADALTWLSAQADESCAAISAFHIVEHLPFDVLFAIIEQAWRVLAPGGMLIMETPNPENVLVGSHTFYHDFSHRNPVTPTSLQFLAGYHGFAVSDVLRLSPYPPEAQVPEASLAAERINGHFCGPQDYAVIAVKDAADARPSSDESGNAAETAATREVDVAALADETGATA